MPKTDTLKSMTTLLERIAEVERLEKEATQGKWRISDFAVHGEPKAEENATFIASLVNLIRDNPGLLMDGVRYKWLREHHLQTGVDSWIRTGDDLDEAIDQAMKETK